MSKLLLSHDPITLPRSEHPPRSVNLFPPASALNVLTAAEAEKLYRRWWTSANREAKLQRLAQEVQSRSPVAVPLTIVYEPDGSLFGVAPAEGELYGFTSPPRTKAEITALGTPHAKTAYRAAVFALAGRLAVAETADALAKELAAFRPQAPDCSTTSDTRPWIVLLKASPAPPLLNAVPGGTDTIIGRLLATYQDDSCEYIQAPGRVRPPQPLEVKRLIDGLFPLLFPGYRGPLPTESGFKSFICRCVSGLQQRLTRLLRRALAFRDSVRVPGGPPPSAYHDAADRIAVAFFDALPEIRRTLDADAEAAYRNDPALPKGDHHSIPLAYPGLYATAVYRLAHQLHILEVPYLPRMMTELAHSRTGIDIHPGARIGRGFFIDHGTGVVIGETAVIGDRVTLYQGVTLGARNFEWDETGNLLRGAKRHPTIHSRTTIYANAAVLGGDVEVGHNSKIGANVSLRHSLMPESVVRVVREESISGGRPADDNAAVSTVTPDAPDQCEKVVPKA